MHTNLDKNATEEKKLSSMLELVENYRAEKNANQLNIRMKEDKTELISKMITIQN